MFETDESENLIAQAQHFALVDAVDFLLVDARDFDDRRERHRKEAAADAEEKRLNAGESQRGAELKGRATRFLRGNVNGSLEFVEDAADNVHANTAAGHFGDFRGGAETGFENEIERFLIREARSFFGLDDALLDGLLADLRGIDAAAVVAHFDDNLRSLMIGVESKRCRARACRR